MQSQTDTSQQKQNPTLRLVRFTVASQMLAADISRVLEILTTESLARSAPCPSEIEGLVRVRNRLVPVLKLGTLLGLDTSEQDEQSRIVVVEIDDQPVGFVVDTVRGVRQVDPAQLRSDPGAAPNIDLGAIAGVLRHQHDTLVVLDIDHLIPDSTLRTIKQLVA